MATATNDKLTHDTEGAASGPDARPEIPNPILGAVPPGALAQIDAEAMGRATAAEAATFLAPAPERGGMILGYGHARTGRMPPHGGSPSTGPLTGVPLTRRGAPTPPVSSPGTRCATRSRRSPPRSKFPPACPARRSDRSIGSSARRQRSGPRVRGAPQPELLGASPQLQAPPGRAARSSPRAWGCPSPTRYGRAAGGPTWRAAQACGRALMSRPRPARPTATRAPDRQLVLAP
jgi:hypothetical protein